MRVLGVIAEYNPFHNGHLYHLRKSRELVHPDYVVAVMSGQFTQRGEAAIVDKWARTKMALLNGVDLVLELPAVFAVQTAELFAYGGIQTLNHTGLVTHVSFGSEAGSLEALQGLAAILAEEPAAYQELLKKHLQAGLSFPQARYDSLKEYCAAHQGHQAGVEWKSILASPNSILGIEYLKALQRTQSAIQPVTFSRIRSGYHSNTMKKGISSATAIRQELLKSGLTPELQKALPKACYEVLKDTLQQGKGPVTNQSLEPILLGLLRRTPLEEMAEWMDVEEGLENRIKSCCLQASSLNEFMELTKTKRYVYTRLQRILIHGLLQITRERVERFMASEGPQYLRILGFRRQAAPLLKQLRSSARVPLLTKPAHYIRTHQPLLKEMFELDVLATDLYALCLSHPSARIGGRDFTEKTVIL